MKFQFSFQFQWNFNVQKVVQQIERQRRVRPPDGDEAGGNRLKWRNKISIMHCEREERKSVEKEKRKQAGKAKRWFIFFLVKCGTLQCSYTEVVSSD